MSRGPVPSNLCLLSSLPYRAEGDKVRFLGCVLAYSRSTGRLKLGHDYPKDAHVTATVDVKLLLETLGEEQTRVGEWVNIVGYVTGKRRSKGPVLGAISVTVQALVLWSTGPMDVQKYERSFEQGS